MFINKVKINICMKKICFLFLIFVILFAGCTSEYSFSENEFENSINLEGQVKDNYDNVTIDGQVKVKKDDVTKVIDRVKEEINFNKYIIFEKVEEDGTVYIKNNYDKDLNVNLRVLDMSCNKEFVLKSKSIEKVEFSGCSFKNFDKVIFEFEVEGKRFKFSAYVKKLEGKNFYGKTLISSYDVRNKSVVLDWKKYEGDKSNFKYYKVVHSTTNPDLKYPEDGYINYITDIDNTHFETSKHFKEGMINYYRITTVLKSGEKIHSNVEKVEVSEGLDVGEGAEEKITSGPEVVQVYVTGTEDGRIDVDDKFAMILRLGTGALPVNLDDLLLKFNSKDGGKDMIYEKTVLYGGYNISYLSNNGQAVKEGYLSDGDLVRIEFLSDEIIEEDEDLMLRFFIKEFSAIHIQMKTPSIMTQDATYLYP